MRRRRTQAIGGSPKAIRKRRAKWSGLPPKIRARPVDRPGRYRFRLRRWPEELDLPLGEGIDPVDANGHIYAPGDGACVTITPVAARIAVGDVAATVAVDAAQKEAMLELDLETCASTTMDAWFVDESGDECGAYYVYVEYLG